MATSELPPAQPAPEDTAQAVVATAPTPQSSMSRGMRETIEAIAIALALAFLFKTFEAEAFVIPTGSMAPTLMGRHKDVACPECGYHYTASGSDEADREGNERNDPAYQVVATTCPVCRFTMSVDPQQAENAGRNASPSYSGDRIWVSKVPYHLMEPRRFDVIVFRFPEEAETYYIKRLVGLPNETVQIFHGDIYVKHAGETEFSIVRKPPEKLRAMAQIVHDNDHVSPTLQAHHWPLRWQSVPAKDGTNSEEAGWKPAEDTRSFHTEGTSAGDAWVRYQHVVPSEQNWRDGRWPPRNKPRPQLITDFYAFNARELRKDPGPAASTLGLHWVGDLILECELDVVGPTGTALFDLVKGGRHFGCAIDVQTGRAQLSIDGVPAFNPTGVTPIRGAGKHQVRFANADRELLLWIDDQLIAFDKPTTYDDLNNDRPQSTDDDAGDLAPLGVGSRGLKMTVNHLRVLRDIYYIADKNASLDPISDYRQATSVVPRMNRAELADFLASPEQWSTARGTSVFDARQEATFDLGPDQFFVLGDNSPASSDARLWHSQHYVERNLLVGKALLIYWPHPLRMDIPFTDKSLNILPNFSEMGLIR